MNRRFLPSAATSLVLAAGAVALYLTAPASATGAPPPVASPPSGTAGRIPSGPVGGDPVEGLQVTLTGASLTSAARRCARWATNAGFANDGYMAGSLTTAVAVALAESGCTARACFDDTRRRACTEGSERRRDSVDRGAWQLNSRSFGSVPNSCAFSGQCAAEAAYSLVSAVGTFFAPWTSYSVDDYAQYLWPAQQAVTRLRTGTVASAVIGSCLGYPSDRAGARAKLENCGRPGGQTWHVAGATLHSRAGLCLAAASRHDGAVVVLSRCSRSRLQQWAARRGDLLYNRGAGRCLSDTSGGDKPGLGLSIESCAISQREGWFRP
jgi:Ricin-type beta-trefoil lectin domain/Lysozyme like domain